MMNSIPHFDDVVDLDEDDEEDEVAINRSEAKSKGKKPMSKGGWSNLLCPNQKPEESVDLAVVFVGRESGDISGRKNEDQKLLDLLKVSFTKSTFSLAYPYVAASEENKPLQTSLVSEFGETCGNDAGLSKLAILESCAAEGGNFEKLADISSVHGQTPLLVFCNEGIEQPCSEGQVLSELISSVEKTGAKYSVLYVSDQVNVTRYPSYRQLDRFLAEKYVNFSQDSTTCDGVCQIKSSLLEGLLVDFVAWQASIPRQDLKLFKNLTNCFPCFGKEYLNTCGACNGSIVLGEL
ncbi:hypothetical protein L1987_78190 [Smallanthus sonchifolius]|uniref:Uncharacterized protein n=1 Tax=Smallanthus sonchifolius TaxID=185202 RepID=A0ACB8ZGG0_9ASTR|nr:hypothetical protein L1987_78190 [Smallanthus sonchifolius]